MAQEKQSLEELLRDIITPIVNEAVANAFAMVADKINSYPVSEPELLDIGMAAEYLRLSVPTIYGLVSKRSIPYCKQGKRLYFLKDDLLNWITNSRRMTISEIDQTATLYSNRKSKNR